MEEWQPIETAPKDGTLILLAEADYVCPGVWDRDSKGEGGQCWRDRVYDMDRIGPTHWMPLPDPPIRKPRSDKGHHHKVAGALQDDVDAAEN